MRVSLKQYLGFFIRLFADNSFMSVLDIVLQTFSMVDFSLFGEKVRGVVFLQTGIPAGMPGTLIGGNYEKYRPRHDFQL